MLITYSVSSFIFFPVLSIVESRALNKVSTCYGSLMYLYFQFCFCFM
jgi:hypothetical protein